MGAKRAAGFVIFRRLNSQIEYLLLQASKNKNNWTPPKGHTDPGEDDFTTALRETQEEAGFTADDLLIFKDQMKTLNYKVNGRDKTVVYWLAELRDPQKNPILSDEHIDFRWLGRGEATSLSGYDDFAKMVHYFHEQIK